MIRVSVLTFFALAVFSEANAEKEMKYTNHIYENGIETVMLSKGLEVYNPMPVINLNGGDRLYLSFDELKPQNDFYQYTFIHCNANWEPSDMQQTEYISGNLIENVQSHTFSTNTFQKYVRYQTAFPSADMRITRSGNYILKVFRNFDESDLILTRRFMVLDNHVRCSGKVTAATDPAKRNYFHEVDFNADYKDYDIPNPFQDVKAVVIQNNNWDNAILGLKPLFVNNNELIFNYEDKNLMPAGHEFRFFDIRSLRFFSNNVAEKYFDSLVNVVLRPEELRSHLAYSYTIDYNGKRVIGNKDGIKDELDSDADYAMVHFYLRSSNPLQKGDVYIFGELSDWRLQEKYKMTYLPAYQGYYAMVKLKQSYYNYWYVTQDEQSKTADLIFTEGNHFETENDYHILIYHRNPFYGYDELIGYHLLNSGRLGVGK